MVCESVERVQLECTELKASHDSLSRRLDGIVESVNKPFSDPCEVLLSGIPAAVDCSNIDSLLPVFSSLKLQISRFHLVSVRSWTPRTRATEAGAGEVTPGPYTNSVVIQCVSQHIRDVIVENSAKLRDVTCQTIFGVGGNTHLFIRALWPKQLFELLNKAYQTAFELKFMKPFVRNLVIYIRKDRNSAPLPIHSQADLDSLVMNNKN